MLLHTSAPSTLTKIMNTTSDRRIHRSRSTNGFPPLLRPHSPPTSSRNGQAPPSLQVGRTWPPRAGPCPPLRPRNIPRSTRLACSRSTKRKATKKSTSRATQWPASLPTSLIFSSQNQGGQGGYVGFPLGGSCYVWPWSPAQLLPYLLLVVSFWEPKSREFRRTEPAIPN